MRTITKNNLKIIALFLFSSSASIVSAAPLLGLTNYYSFDGNANDSVGGQHGTLFGDTTFGSGVQGQAVSFDGNSDFVKVGGGTLIGNDTTWSMSGWFFLNNNTQRHSLFGEYSSVNNGDTQNYMVYSPPADLDDGLTYDNFPTSGGAVGSGSGTVNPNQWHAFTISRDASVMSIYIDGLLESTGTFETYTGATATMAAFGARLADDTTVYTPGDPIKYSMNGLLDDIRIYDRALTSAEVMELASVPEPLPLTMLGAGLAVLGLRRKFLVKAV